VLIRSVMWTTQKTNSFRVLCGERFLMFFFGLSSPWLTPHFPADLLTILVGCGLFGATRCYLPPFSTDPSLEWVHDSPSPLEDKQALGFGRVRFVHERKTELCGVSAKIVCLHNGLGRLGEWNAYPRWSLQHP
jgi:hypothetical protein